MSYLYKNYQIVSEGTYALKSIKPVGKGSVHKELTGLYTSSAEAEKSIDRFLSEKERVDAQAKKSG